MHDCRDDLTLLRDRRFALLLGARSMSMPASAFAPVALAPGVITGTTLLALLSPGVRGLEAHVSPGVPAPDQTPPTPAEVVA